MKGYAVADGYMGYIGTGIYMLFACESDYREYLLDTPDGAF